MKLRLALATGLVFALGCTKTNPGNEMRQPQNADSTRRRVAPPSEEQRRLMADCIGKKGQKLPERPQLSEEQRQTMVKCKTDNREGGLPAFQKCVQKAGIRLPEPPSQELRQAIMECRQEIMSAPK